MKAKVQSIEAARRQQIVDEYGQLDAKVTAFVPTVRRYDELKAIIRGWYADAPADEVQTAEGGAYIVSLGVRAKKRSILSMKELKNRLGLHRFLQLCTFPLEALDKAVLRAEQAGLVSEEQTGTRSISVSKKHTGAQAA